MAHDRDGERAPSPVTGEAVPRYHDLLATPGAKDLGGSESIDTESHLAVRLRALEARISESPAVAGAVLSLSAPDEPTLLI